MKHALKPKRKITWTVKTPEDWFPSFDGGFVEVAYNPGDGWLRVWGADDFGMEAVGISREKAEWLISAPITRARCKLIGLRPA